jgi:hypothetical protein
MSDGEFPMKSHLQLTTRLERLEKSGRGTGWGRDYRSLLEVHEISSYGLIHRLACWRFGNRQFNLFANAEKAVFLHYWFDQSTVQIYDGVRCSRDATLDIARRLGVRHPEASRGVPAIVSTDLLIVRETADGLVERAVSIKYAGRKLKDKDHRNLLIQKIYHEERGREWRFSSNFGLNSNRARNLNWLFFAAERSDRGEITVGELHAQDAVLSELRSQPHRTAEEACRAATARFRLPAHAAAGAFRMLLATQALIADMDAPALLDLPPAAFSIRRSPSDIGRFLKRA